MLSLQLVACILAFSLSGAAQVTTAQQAAPLVTAWNMRYPLSSAVSGPAPDGVPALWVVTVAGYVVGVSAQGAVVKSGLLEGSVSSAALWGGWPIHAGDAWAFVALTENGQLVGWDGDFRTLGGDLCTGLAAPTDQAVVAGSPVFGDGPLSGRLAVATVSSDLWPVFRSCLLAQTTGRTVPPEALPYLAQLWLSITPVSPGSASEAQAVLLRADGTVWLAALAAEGELLATPSGSPVRLAPEGLPAFRAEVVASGDLNGDGASEVILLGEAAGYEDHCLAAATTGGALLWAAPLALPPGPHPASPIAVIAPTATSPGLVAVTDGRRDVFVWTGAGDKVAEFTLPDFPPLPGASHPGVGELVLLTLPADANLYCVLLSAGKLARVSLGEWLAHQPPSGGARGEGTPPARHSNLVHWYNAADYLTSLTNANSETTSWTYNDVGLPTRQDNANSTYAEWTYNANRYWITDVHNKKSDASTISRFQYTRDSVGNPTAMTETNGTLGAASPWSYTFTYDNVYQLTGETKKDKDVNTVYTISYEYDAAGNRTKKTEDGNQTNYSYDDFNKMTEVW